MKKIAFLMAGDATFGCMSMGFLMVEERLGDALVVPVVNPVKAAVKTAEMLVELGVTHSKLVYPVPSLRR